MKKTMDIIQNDVHEVLDMYLCGELMADIERKIVSDIRQDLISNEPDRMQTESDFNDCVNELCLRCGSYKREHEGACDGCRWLKPRRGW